MKCCVPFIQYTSVLGMELYLMLVTLSILYCACTSLQEVMNDIFQLICNENLAALYLLSCSITSTVVQSIINVSPAMTSSHTCQVLHVLLQHCTNQSKTLMLTCMWSWTSRTISCSCIGLKYFKIASWTIERHPSVTPKLINHRPHLL